MARQAVLGEGPVPCDWMFLAEAPGQMENYAGRPLVGPSGGVFTKLLERFTVLRRPDVYVTNVVKHWPGPGNPTPKAGQCKAYRPYLHWELSTVRPKVVVAMGAVAAREFLKGVRIKAQHGQAHACEIPGVWSGVLVVWYHPAMAVRKPEMFDVLIADAEKLREEIDRLDRATPIPAYVLDDGTEAVAMCLARWGEYGFDTETTSPTRGGMFATDEAEMVGFSMSGASGTGLYVPTGAVDAGMESILTSPLWTKVCHNTKFELKVLARTGVELVGWEDTKLAAYLLGYNRTGLKDLTREILGHQPVQIRALWPKDGPSMENCTYQQAYDTYEREYEYAAADADNTLRLWPEFKQRLIDEELWELYEMEKRLTPVLVGMERTGMAVDEVRCQAVAKALATRTSLISMHRTSSNACSYS